MRKVRRSYERGYADHGWLKRAPTYTFSPAVGRDAAAALLGGRPGDLATWRSAARGRGLSQAGCRFTACVRVLAFTLLR